MFLRNRCASPQVSYKRKVRCSFAALSTIVFSLVHDSDAIKQIANGNLWFGSMAASSLPEVFHCVISPTRRATPARSRIRQDARVGSGLLVMDLPSLRRRELYEQP